MSSRRSESRNLTANAKVGGSRMSPRVVRCPVDHDTWVTGERNKREEKRLLTKKKEMPKPGQRAGRRSLSSLGKAASHRQRSYGEEGPMTIDLPRRARRKGFISSAIVHEQQVQLRTGLILGRLTRGLTRLGGVN